MENTTAFWNQGADEWVVTDRADPRKLKPELGSREFPEASQLTLQDCLGLRDTKYL